MGVVLGEEVGLVSSFSLIGVLTGGRGLISKGFCSFSFFGLLL